MKLWDEDPGRLLLRCAIAFWRQRWSAKCRLSSEREGESCVQCGPWNARSRAPMRLILDDREFWFWSLQVLESSLQQSAYGVCGRATNEITTMRQAGPDSSSRAFAGSLTGIFRLNTENKISIEIGSLILCTKRPHLRLLDNKVFEPACSQLLYSVIDGDGDALRSGSMKCITIKND